MKVIAYTKYDREAASTRQRLLQFLPALDEAGIVVEVRSLLGDNYVRALAMGQRLDRSVILRAYGRRWRQLGERHNADLLWVYAELFPWLPVIAERRILRAGLPIVYDMDDAFFVPYEQHRSPAVRAILDGKLKPLIAGSAAATCGNAFLADYARPLCARTLIVPTVVDTDRYVPATGRRTGAAVIGWIGSPSTWAFVRPSLPLLAKLCIGETARFLTVGAGPAAQPDAFASAEFRRWSEEREIVDLQAMDIGIMPLPDEPWARGKCGYKLIQYMACGLPVVASPVGVNREIVEHGVNGFLAKTPDEWRAALETLIADPALRGRMGEAGRARVVERYSLKSQAPRIVELFRSLVTDRAVRSLAV